MSGNIRVMICDDSSLMRRLMSSTLNQSDRLTVVCEAVHGRDALNKLPETRPDVVIMDVQMPVLDGIDTVREIRKVDRKLPVIVFSALTHRGADATLEAMSAGASDFVTKPAEVGHINHAIRHLREELIPKILRLVDCENAKAPAVKPNGTVARQVQRTCEAPIKGPEFGSSSNRNQTLRVESGDD